MIDIEAIRARNKKRSGGCLPADGEPHPMCSSDIDALLAEVERLRHVAGECACTHAPDGQREKQCAYILREAGPDRREPSLTPPPSAR